MIAIIIILCVLLLAVGIFLILNIKKQNKLIDTNNRLTKSNTELSNLNSGLSAVNTDLTNKNTSLAASNQTLVALNESLTINNTELKTINVDLTDKLSKIPVTINDEVVAHQVLEEQIKELTKQAEELKLSEQQRNDAITKLDELIKQLTEQNTGLKEEQNNLLQSIRDARKIISDIENNEFGYKLPGTNAREKDLVLLLEDIANKYNYIAEDIRGISWKRVWLPKIQKLVKDCNADGTMGIYKITVKHGDDLFNYVGKTSDFKTRWYNHLGKMCGKEPTGNEILYKKVSIKELLDDDVEIYFSILEVITDANLLEAAEHRWITALGDLNIKA